MLPGAAAAISRPSKQCRRLVDEQALPAANGERIHPPFDISSYFRFDIG
jgi:hypothetical protein